MFRNRIDAGRQLADALEYLKPKDPLVMALPRGGAILGAEVAHRLDCQLGLILVRKITHPLSPEYAIGVATEGLDVIWNEQEAETYGQSWRDAEAVAAQEVLRERREYYFEGRNEPSMKDRCVIIVDDGIATGFTMYGAIRAARQAEAASVIAAAPVASQDALAMLRPNVDELVVLEDAATFGGYVGAQYQEFHQVSDEDVKRVLEQTIYQARDGP